MAMVSFNHGCIIIQLNTRVILYSLSITFSDYCEMIPRSWNGSPPSSSLHTYMLLPFLLDIASAVFLSLESIKAINKWHRLVIPVQSILRASLVQLNFTCGAEVVFKKRLIK